MKKLIDYLKQVFNKKDYYKDHYKEDVKKMAKHCSKIVVTKDTEKSFKEKSDELLSKMMKELDEHTDKITKKYKLRYKVNENYIFRFSVNFDETLIRDLGTIGWRLVSVIKCSKRIKGKDVEGYKYIFISLR